MMQSPKDQLIDSAVLVPIFRDDNGDVRLVFIQRNEGGIHGGQIGFPGGKHDPGDQSMLATAIREAHEEIGISSKGIDVIADLPVIETHSTGYRIYPFLARIVPPPEWHRDKREIAGIFTVKLDDLARPEIQGDEVRYFPRLRRSLRIFFYLVDEHKIWGVTYRMLQSLIPRLVAGEWEI